MINKTLTSHSSFLVNARFGLKRLDPLLSHHWPDNLPTPARNGIRIWVKWDYISDQWNTLDPNSSKKRFQKPYIMHMTKEVKLGFFGWQFVKQFALCYWTVVCRVCLSVCNVGVSWQNGWMDHDETWHGDRLWHKPHCIRWGLSPPHKKGHSPQFLAHVYCDQTAGWIKIPFGMEVGLGPGDIVLDGDPAAPPQKKCGTAPT